MNLKQETSFQWYNVLYKNQHTITGAQLVLKLLLFILIIPIIILGSFFIINVIPFPQSLEVIKDQIAAVTAGILSFIYLVFISIYSIFLFRKAGKVFEDIFLKLNLKPANYRFFGRQYKGYIDDWPVIIEYFPPRAIHRSILNIYLNANMGSMGVSNKKIPVFNNIKINDFNFYSEDTNIQKLLTNKGFKSSLDLILNDGNKRNIKQVYLFPDKIWFRMVLSNISKNDLLVLLKNLADLAEKIEDLGKTKIN